MDSRIPMVTLHIRGCYLTIQDNHHPKAINKSHPQLTGLQWKKTIAIIWTKNVQFTFLLSEAFLTTKSDVHESTSYICSDQCIQITFIADLCCSGNIVQIGLKWPTIRCFFPIHLDMAAQHNAPVHGVKAELFPEVCFSLSIVFFRGWIISL